jgi:hypothetical protein
MQKTAVACEPGEVFAGILPAQHRATVYVEDFPGDERGVFGA